MDIDKPKIDLYRIEDKKALGRDLEACGGAEAEGHANERGFAMRVSHLEGVDVAMGVETPAATRRPKRCVIGGVCMSVETGTGLSMPRTT